MYGDFRPTEQLLWPVSILSGIFMCKIVYAITGQISTSQFKEYRKLSSSQKVEWNNRGFSTFHAILAAVISLYLLAVSNLFSDDANKELIISRKSFLSDAMFGISIGYFLSDLTMILWLFPALGGKEYILHHCLSLHSILLALVSGKAHVYILMVLLSEVTTPFVNLRWYLDIAGQKRSSLYIYNGVALFLGWLAARVLLFIYLFIHMYFHFDEVRSLFPLGFFTMVVVPPLLTSMNLFWLWKIFKGMLKTLARSHTQ